MGDTDSVDQIQSDLLPISYCPDSTYKSVRQRNRQQMQAADHDDEFKTELLNILSPAAKPTVSDVSKIIGHEQITELLAILKRRCLTLE